MSTLSVLAQEILDAGMDDWVPLAAVEGLARRHAMAGDQAIRDSGLEAIKELVLAWLVEPGEVADGGFFGWDETPDRALRRIMEIWESSDPNVWGFAVWLSNTPAGDEWATIPRG